MGATDSANAFSAPEIPPTRALVQDDAGPYTTSPSKLVVHSAGTRNPFGLCLDDEGRLFFTNNYNRASTVGDGTGAINIPRDAAGPDLRPAVHDQLFLAAEGADYGYADEVWRGRSPMLPTGARGSNRATSITFDNLANQGPYTLHDPARPDGLGPSSSANGCAFFYAEGLPADLAGNLFIARYNPSVADSSGRSIRYADIVAVDVSTGIVKRATGFQSPIAVLWDGARRLLVADFTTGTNKPGAIYSLAVSH